MVDARWLQLDHVTANVKLGICAALLAATWLAWRYRRIGAERRLKKLNVVVACLGFLSVAAYFWFGNYRGDSVINYHDVFNYYMGSKYHRELGYSTLYSAVALADLEGEQLFRVARGGKIRDLSNLRRVPRTDVIPDAAMLMKPFTAARWNEFKKDIEWLGRPTKSKAQILIDMGHNGTPFWTAWAGELFNQLPARSEAVLLVLCCVDLVILLVMFLVLGRLIGWLPMWIALILFTTNYALHTWTIRGSLFRFDWLAAMALGVGFLYRKHYKSAGAMFAYATLVRVFPLFFIFGLGVKSIQSLIRERRLSPAHARFWASFSLTSILFVAGSALHAGGFHQWSGFLSKIDDHSSHISPKRWGVTYAGFMESEKLLTRVETRFRDWNKDHTRWWIALGAVAIATAVAWRLEDHETPALGVFILFFTANATWYYYCVLLVCYLVLVTRLDRRGNLMGIWLMAILAISGYVVHLIYSTEISRHTTVSTILLAILPLTMLSLYLATWQRGSEVADDSADALPSAEGGASHHGQPGLPSWNG